MNFSLENTGGYQLRHFPRHTPQCSWMHFMKSLSGWNVAFPTSLAKGAGRKPLANEDVAFHTIVYFEMKLFLI